MYAASGGSTECLRVLDSCGASLDMQNKDGLSALIYAIQNRQSEAVSVLLDLGANPYVANVMGTGALHWAAKKGDVESCRALLDHGVAVDALNNKKVTPLVSHSHEAKDPILSTPVSDSSCFSSETICDTDVRGGLRSQRRHERRGDEFLDRARRQGGRPG